MTVPVLAAVTGASWEAALVAGLERTPTGITVVRRCVDLADLLAAASTGTARAALLSAELRRLDRDALARLSAARVAVVGLFSPGDEEAETRLRQLGVADKLVSSRNTRNARRRYQGLPSFCTADCSAAAIGLSLAWLYEIKAS